VPFGDRLLSDAAPANPALADPAPADSTDLLDRFSLAGYGVVNYFNYDWETVPEKRSVVDLERFVLYPGVRLAEGVRLLGEIEFEHGGTGVTKEFDRFEEAGEFENEIESGGEVVLEQLNVTFDLRENLRLRAGRFKIPVGLASVNDEPPEYFATTRAEMEAEMIPTNWYEIGVQGEASYGRVDVSAAVVNGLNSAEFSAANWIVRGNQQKFEDVAAEDLAFTGRVDVRFGEESFAGLSGYIGDSADNRRKSTLLDGGEEVSALVSVVDAHLQVREGPWTARGVVLYGHLQNSGVVADNNRGLSNNLNAKRTPVGSDALGYRVEGGVDVLSLLASTDQRLDVFGRHSFYDTQWRTDGSVSDDPLWKRSVIAAGLNWHVVEPVVVKAEYSRRVRGRERSVRGGSAGDRETTVSVGLGFEF
jgi:hypothetical protein